ncbi:hypothetical protein Taro_018922 [Colocasia esculenta]|uniref:Uncharacterized protein n=1 Tax=Colocasia esculenta TaxID=4460 RepID=A0A843V0K4_COLES|nr:hypothetical protein [Colocasia esculenta]
MVEDKARGTPDQLTSGSALPWLVSLSRTCLHVDADRSESWWSIRTQCRMSRLQSSTRRWMLSLSRLTSRVFYCSKEHRSNSGTHPCPA